MQEHPHLPKRERQKGWLPAILLSGAVHGVLFLGLFTVFQWQTRAEFVYAELWAPEDVSGGNDPTGVAERVEAPEPTPGRTAARTATRGAATRGDASRRARAP